MQPTGRCFETEILDDTGRFELPEIALESPYVRLSADGFYSNEVSGELSDARRTLTALASVTESSSVNVNVLSHLERFRVEYLIEADRAFADAKQQAQEEVLAILTIELQKEGTSESLDIAGDGDKNAALLALSLTLQGAHRVAQMSEILSNISTDLREDGVLNSTTSGSALLNEATLTNLAEVRCNLISRYDSLGQTATIGDFETHVAHFKESTQYVFDKDIEYPESGRHGLNILSEDNAPLGPGLYSIYAILPAGTSLTVELTNLEQDPWGYDPAQANQWRVSRYEQSTGQTFTARELESDMDILLNAGPGNVCLARLRVYEMAPPLRPKVGSSPGAPVGARASPTLERNVSR